jgi:hypothetical protein
MQQITSPQQPALAASAAAELNSKPTATANLTVFDFMVIP